MIALQTLSKLFAVGLAVAVFFVPRTRTPVQVAALAAAVLIAVQVTANHWFYPVRGLVRSPRAYSGFCHLLDTRASKFGHPYKLIRPSRVENSGCKVNRERRRR